MRGAEQQSGDGTEAVGKHQRIEEVVREGVRRVDVRSAWRRAQVDEGRTR